MPQATIKQLLEAGVHFGHQTSRWNPKMKRYIFGERNGIYIINLELTLGCLTSALEFLTETAASGREVLFIGTKKQAQDILKDAAERCGMPYVNQRWLGGMLTNFETVLKSVRKLDEIDKMEKEGGFDFVTKKEAGEYRKEREKLTKNLSGIRHMKNRPGALFVIDSKKEENALSEARKLGIPIVAVLDTNCNPDIVDYPLPGNDDAIRAIKLFCDLAAQAVLEGREKFKNSQAVAGTEALEASVSEAQDQEGTFASIMAGKEAVELEEVISDGIPDSLEEKLAEKYAKPGIVETKEKVKPKKAVRGEGKAK